MGATRVVRMLAEDIERLGRLSGLPEEHPFAAKVHAVLERLEGRKGHVDDVRLAVRDELARLLDGA